MFEGVSQMDAFKNMHGENWCCRSGKASLSKVDYDEGETPTTSCIDINFNSRGGAVMSRIHFLFHLHYMGEGFLFA